jgi:hypothetical protein
VREQIEQLQANALVGASMVTSYVTAPQ